ncbi:MAG: 30S ribosomal protein S5 [Candidatus Hadarchaeales archaeon]
MEREGFDINLWEPRTALGKKVKAGEITNISEILRSGQRIMEPEIVAALVPDMREEILSLGMMQRMHKSGRRVRYRIVVVVGNGDGIVGVGAASAREVSSAIEKATNAARLNVIEVARGCGSWECGCNRPHSVPAKVSGKSGSVEVALKPAPRGLGIVAAEIPKIILRMAGVKDVWTQASGETRSTYNFAFATYEALKRTVGLAFPERVAGSIVIGKAGEHG